MSDSWFGRNLRVFHDDLERAAHRLTHHSATVAVDVYPHPQGAPVATLSEVVDSIRDRTVQSTGWLQQIIDHDLPVILAAAERYEQSKIGKALLAAGDAVNPEIEQVIVSIINLAAAHAVVGQPAEQAPQQEQAA